MYGVALPIIAIPGIFANLASVVVFSQKSLRSSINVYLAALDCALLLLSMWIYPLIAYCLHKQLYCMFHIKLRHNVLLPVHSRAVQLLRNLLEVTSTIDIDVLVFIKSIGKVPMTCRNRKWPGCFMEVFFDNFSCLDFLGYFFADYVQVWRQLTRRHRILSPACLF